MSGRGSGAGAGGARGAAVGLFWVMVLAASGLVARQPEQDIDAHLAAGEFGPAVELAKSLPDPGTRDRSLGRIAAAQAQWGARTAARRTLADIHGDESFIQAAESIRGNPVGAGGGAAMADFTTLIDLITTTIAPDSWEDVGGAGAISPFPTGVFVDTSGLMRPLPPPRNPSRLDRARREAARDRGNRNVRTSSPLRKVSLVRLERELQVRRALGEQPDEAMHVLAGLHRLRYLFVYPDTGDLVVAGPAGDWQTDSQGRVVNTETGEPVWRLDDLLVVWRNATERDGQFGCAIKPTREHLAATKAFVDAWRPKSLKPGQRDQWLTGLREALGRQQVEVWGIDPRTNAARVLVEADYHMKLIGMGLEQGTFGVISYLEAVKRAAPETPPEMTVLRWWFTLNYQAVSSTPARDAFECLGTGVKVLSENELLTATGERIHTGESELLNRQFARSFTQHYDALAAKYPIYAELRNIFDMAIVAGLIRSHDLSGQVRWSSSHLSDVDACPVRLGPLPREVESVINAIELNRKTLLAGVSGGVAVDTRSLVKSDAIRVDDYGLMEAAHGSARSDHRHDLPRDAWWWD
jgi:hypothetical protein